MGNRAVIQFGTEAKASGIYLHWNGGPESVRAFLDAAKELDVRTDDTYGPARLCQIIGNWFGGTLSIGVGSIDDMDCDNGDNGLYVVDEAFNIVARKHTNEAPNKKFDAREQESYDNIKEQVLVVNRPFFNRKLGETTVTKNVSLPEVA